MTKKIDLLDKKILQELDVDSRIPVKQLGKKVRASKETVNYRIKRLVRRGYIRYFYTLLNMNKVGYFYYRVYIRFHASIEPEKEKEIIKYLRSRSLCSDLRIVEGPYDMDFTVTAKTPHELSVFLSKFKDTFGDYVFKKDVHQIVRTYKMNQRFFVPGKKIRVSFSQAKRGESKLDQMDKNILAGISRKSNIKLTELGSKLNVSPKVLAYRIKRMKKEGIILGHTIKPNFTELGLQRFQMDIALKKMDTLPAMVSFFEATGKCLFAYKLLGRYDLSAEIFLPDNVAIRKMTNDFKKRFRDRYNHFDISNVLKKYVISWSPFDIKKRDK